MLLIFKINIMYKKGYSVVEVLLAGSILALAIAGIVGSLVVAQRNNQANIAQRQALSMAKEGIEALKSIRDRNYKDLVNVNSGALSFNSGKWTLNQNPGSNDDQLTKPLRTRRVKIEKDPDLNSSNDTEGTVAKKVTVKVEYQLNPEGKISTIELSETLANILTPKATGVTAESRNYRLIDDSVGDIRDNNLKKTTP